MLLMSEFKYLQCKLQTSLRPELTKFGLTWVNVFSELRFNELTQFKNNLKMVKSVLK